MFLASLSFFFTFAVTRIITHASRASTDPLQFWVGGIHVHHLVWGILLLLVVGYIWLIQLGTGAAGPSIRVGRITAVLYGAGAALTLDEYALWLNLEDVYWERAGRASIDAVALFGALVSAGLWGGPFFRSVTRHGTRVLRWRPRRARSI
jgi:nucleoside recognition membrane protein YjiH